MKFMFLILALVVSTSVFAYECGDHPFSSTSKQDGSKIGLFATLEDFDGSKSWSIENGEPPLSISEAVVIVKAWAASFYTRFDSVAVSSFRMQGDVCWKAKDQWVYVFDLAPIIDGNKLYGSAYMAAVTMSGKVIEPREYSE